MRTVLDIRGCYNTINNYILGRVDHPLYISIWYHIHLAINTGGLSGSRDRIKEYIQDAY